MSDTPMIRCGTVERSHREQADRPTVLDDETASARDHLDVVVGAGMAGLYALHKLREASLRAVALEAEAGVGGTWYRNVTDWLHIDVIDNGIGVPGNITGSGLVNLRRRAEAVGGSSAIEDTRAAAPGCDGRFP